MLQHLRSGLTSLHSLEQSLLEVKFSKSGICCWWIKLLYIDLYSCGRMFFWLLRYVLIFTVTVTAAPGYIMRSQKFSHGSVIDAEIIPITFHPADFFCVPVR